jgi:superfamily II DNA/RNA helicase
MKRQTLFFSATLDGEVRRLARAYTSNARAHEHVPRHERKADVKHHFVRVSHDGKLEALVRELRREGRGLTLVFVRTKRGADRLVKRLRSSNIEALAMHGDKSQGQRERALARFGAGSVNTLVATDVAARGLDVDDVTHVINYDAPADRDGYVHRVGRTGRAGRTGTGVTFVAADQTKLIEGIARDLSLKTGLGGNGNGAVENVTRKPGNRPPRGRRQRRR